MLCNSVTLAQHIVWCGRSLSVLRGAKDRTVAPAERSAIMQMPHVLNVLEDGSRKIRYEVMAYRSLSREELIVAVRTGISMK